MIGSRSAGHFSSGREWESSEHKARPSRASPREVTLFRALEKIGKRFLCLFFFFLTLFGFEGGGVRRKVLMPM